LSLALKSRIMFKYNRNNLKKLETIFELSGYTIRYERGTFKSGYCMVENNNMIVINKFFDVEGRINTLLEIEQNITIQEDNLDEKSMEFYQKLANLDPAIS